MYKIAPYHWYPLYRWFCLLYNQQYFDHEILNFSRFLSSCHTHGNCTKYETRYQLLGGGGFLDGCAAQFFNLVTYPNHIPGLRKNTDLFICLIEQDVHIHIHILIFDFYIPSLLAENKVYK